MYLTYDEFENLMEKVELGINKSELRFVIQEADENENGVLDPGESTTVSESDGSFLIKKSNSPLTNSSGARWSSCIDRRSQYLRRSSSTSSAVLLSLLFLLEKK